MLTAKRTLHEVFTCLVFERNPSLGEVIKIINWGSNRDIRQKGFRVDDQFSPNSPFFSRRVKEIPKITDPNHKIDNGWAILTPKGDKVVVVRIEQ
jgi:hypothetical protein